MKRNALLGLVMLAACATPALATNVLIESWDGALDGWQVPSPFGSNTSFAPAFSTTTGVTNGSDSLAISSATAGPNYSQLAIGPSTTGITTVLGGSSAINLDIYTPPGSFGFFLQFDMDINNSDTGFVSLDGFSYPSTTIGAETTLSFPISPSVAATLAASTNPTQIILQVGGGFTAGNETMYLDNLNATMVAPEPASLGLISLGALSMLRRRRA